MKSKIYTPNAGQNIITRGLPKTGQVIEYQADDDGTYEAGWWLRRLNANNRTRFIAKTIAGDDIVLDRATGLMWAADGNAAGCNNGAIITWGAGIIYANGLNFAGFSDWRMPNINELLSIVNYTEFNPAIDETFFPNTSTLAYWTSTTVINVTTFAWNISFSVGITAGQTKTANNHLRCVRGCV